MNKRIQELAIQAGAEIKTLEDGTEYRSLYKEDGTGFDLEKFAELIVEECAGLCSTHEMADEPFGEKSYRKGRHFDVMIRQHFGVE